MNPPPRHRRADSAALGVLFGRRRCRRHRWGRDRPSRERHRHDRSLPVEPAPPMSRRSERGSGTLLTLFMGLLLATALAMATLWSAISIARHKLAAAADLTALSAAQALASGTSDPCTTAHRIAATNRVDLAACQLAPDSVSVRVTTQLNLATIARPTLSATARAGPT
jgi:secretion/DNA translocation related TadE-like protein